MDRVIRHSLSVMINPERHSLVAEDLVILPQNMLPEASFNLHRGLEPSSPTPGVSIVRETREQGDSLFESFRVNLPPGQDCFLLRYGGAIHHPLEPLGKEQARGFSQTSGLISEDGVYLTGSSLWYPAFEKGLLNFTLDVDMPSGWDAVSQGDRVFHGETRNRSRVRWTSPEPQEEMVMAAGRFTEYTEPAGRISSMVFLRNPDRNLARAYLDATARYLAMYNKLIGPYPYTKFALVENFWDSGLGMPSFTLLGPKVIRLPFILHSSYPHEILHSWWGNSVFPDYLSGNWSEGLTAYLSDHLIREQQGWGAEYRLETLQKYLDYVLSGRDFPLTEFRSRHSSSSEAVGYGKSLMFFHMIRKALGDRVFIQGLQDFFAHNRFRSATYDDLRKSFESVSGKDLKSEFRQWINRQGAPKITVSKTATAAEGEGYFLTSVIEQIQPGDAYFLRIPIAVTMEGVKHAFQTTVIMDKKRIELRIPLPSRPLRIDVDPEFDLFRSLHRDEIPPALSQALGAKKMLVLLPSSTTKVFLRAYQLLSETLRKSGPDEVEVMFDNEIKMLPKDCAVTVLGWENRFLDEVLSALSGYEVALKGKSLWVDKSEFPLETHAVVLTAKNPANKEQALAFIASGRSDALPGLGRKLTHYHKYSYLAFEGDEPVNVAKGRWNVLDSPMTSFVEHDGRISEVNMAPLSSREPLALLPETCSADSMMDTIRFLTQAELQGRGFGSEGLDRTAAFIAAKFQEAGLKPSVDEKTGYLQTWEEEGGKSGQTVIMKNVVGVIPGRTPALSMQSVVVGAHYDHLGLGWPEVRENTYRGSIHPGADDNASGVAVLLELARVLGRGPVPERAIVFVAFTGEEAGRRGSRHYVSKQGKYPVDQCIGMVNLDTVGRLGKNKLLVLGSDSAKDWVHILKGAGFASGVEIETVSEKLDSSDNRSFEDVGVLAIQLFTGPHLDYHRPTDTADKIDPEGLLRIASVAREVVEHLSYRQDFMQKAGKPREDVHPVVKKERQVSLGTVPDFAYKGVGVRLSGVVPGSPAGACGLRQGDVIIRLNSHDIGNLKDLSRILAFLTPGTRVSIIIMRDGKEMTVETEVRAK